jgi:ribosomal protein S18 acetylase RimI-like enzyme
VALRLGTSHGVGPDRAFGRLELRKLDWDTGFFGRKMGTLALAMPLAPRDTAEAIADDLRFALEQAAADGYAHLIFRVPAGAPRLIHAAEQAGMRLVDIGIDLGLQLDGTRLPSLANADVRPATGDDIEDLCLIAEDAFGFSRFGADPFFGPDQVTAFHRQWTTNLCNGLAAVVLVAEAADEIAGFVACSLDGNAARIPLIATSDAHRRQGIGRALIGAALRWSGAAGARTIRVKTQAANYPALVLYERMGFTIASSELTFSAAPTGPREL